MASAAVAGQVLAVERLRGVAPEVIKLTKMVPNTAHDLHAVLLSMVVVWGSEKGKVLVGNVSTRGQPLKLSLVAEISGSQPHRVDSSFIQSLAELNALLSGGQGQQSLSERATVLVGSEEVLLVWLLVH